MPNKEFIEEFPLYRKFFVDSLPAAACDLPEIRINMICRVCKSAQTFAMTNKYHELFGFLNAPIAGQILRMVYRCTHCLNFERFIFFKIDEQRKWLMKIGQFPPWEISGDQNIERLLGKHAGYYTKGLICESQGYGIGAFGYYRRIVEEIIDELLGEIADLLIGAELAEYQEALEATKQTIVAQEKISLVKDLLPPILRPDGMNPLGVLHSALSEGLHADSDETCLEFASTCRTVLLFLVNQVAASKEASMSFTESMKKLLDKKAGPQKKSSPRVRQE
jgi:hypothetical protein